MSTPKLGKPFAHLVTLNEQEANDHVRQARGLSNYGRVRLVRRTLSVAPLPPRWLYVVIGWPVAGSTLDRVVNGSEVKS